MGAYSGTPVQLVSGNRVTGTWAADLYALQKAITDPWTSYPAAWTGASTNPTLGNGTLAASYRQVGHTLDIKGSITIGSTTVLPTGVWFISLPSGLTAVDTVGAGAAVIFDSSAAATRMAASCNLSTTAKIQFWPGTGGGQVTQAVPMAWNTSDLLIWSFTGIELA